MERRLIVSIPHESLDTVSEIGNKTAITHCHIEIHKSLLMFFSISLDKQGL